MEEFNAQGDCIKYTTYNDDGSVENHWEYEYHSKGKKSKEVYSYTLMSNEIKEEIRYDINGNVIVDLDYENGKLIRQSYTEYNDKNQRIKDVLYLNDFLSQWCEFEYDTAGNIIEIISRMSDGSIYTRQVIEYHSNGKRAHYIKYSGDSDYIWKEEYYDESGNLIQQ